MLAKITSKNQITIPKAIMQQMGKVDYVRVSFEDGRVILTPTMIQSADVVRNKLATLGITEQDIEDAISWGRKAF